MVSAPEVVSSQAEERQATVPNVPDMSPPVIGAFNDAVGRVSIITTIDGKRFNGFFGGIGYDENVLSIATHHTTEITEKNRANLMRCESETREKVTFKFDEIVDIQVLSHDGRGQKLASKFVTDRVYHGEALNDDEALQEWCGGEEEGDEIGSIEDQEPSNTQHNRRSNQNNGPGWSVNDMFAANEKMNVVSTFKDDLTQYTTAEIIGTDEDRARAERLAREIESNQSSKFYANLENDDIERDLDKTTREDDFEYNGRRRGNNSYNQQQQRRNQNPNITPNGQPVNRRAEGLRGDRRNSGGSSANNRSYGSGPSQNYQQQGSKGGYGNNNRRQNDDYRENDWQMAKGKGQNQGNEQSFRHQQKQMLDPRPSPKQATAEGDKSQSSNSRVAELKSWGNDFEIASSPKEQSPAAVAAAPAQNKSGSAWNRGPPSSLVGKGSSSTESTPPPAEVESTAQSGQAGSSKQEDLPSTSGEEKNDVDGKQTEGDNMSTTGASETSSIATSKSTSFKFNINAPEFKPRVAPTTPTPTTPTGATPQGDAIPAQQFVHQEYQQQQHPGMIMQGAPMGMPGTMVHMGPGVPTSQGQPVMMWQQGGPQAYAPNQQYQMQQMPMPGVPGQMYGPGATAPVTVQNAGNQQLQNNSGGASTDGRPGNAPVRREGGEYKETPQCFYPFTQGGPIVTPIPTQFYQPQYPAMPQGHYQMKTVPQQGPQGYQRGYQQQVFVPRYQGQHQQPHFVNEQQGAPQSHPNSQPTTPGPRGEQNVPKQGQPQPQNGNNTAMPEGRSSASLSGSASSQSGQRCGSPHNGVPQQQQAPPPPQGPPQHPQGPMVGVPPGYMPQCVVIPQGHHQMHPQHPSPYYQQQGMYYVMQQQMPMQPNQHNQQSVMGERADQGYPQSNYFDYRNMPVYQHQQPPHGGHMSRQNSLPQQFTGGQGVTPSGQQIPTPTQQQQPAGNQPQPQQQAQSAQ